MFRNVDENDQIMQQDIEVDDDEMKPNKQQGLIFPRASNGKNSKNFDIDSGISSISNTSHTTMDHNHVHGGGNTSCSNSGDESIDSFETCGEDTTDTATAMSSEKLHFSDANENLPPPSRLKKSPSSTNTTKKQADERERERERESVFYEKPEYTSIVSELFDGKLISQVQCLECNHFSTTTETFQHLSLPIPSKEYLQALHTKILNSKHASSQRKSSSSMIDDENSNDNNDGDEENSSHDLMSQSQSQGWLSWMADIIKGYIWNTTIKLTECLTAFFSDDDLKGDNMYSCEKCKK